MKVFKTINAGIIISMLFGVSPLPESNKFESRNPFNTVDYSALPPRSYFILRNQDKICYREYPANAHNIMIYIHGITGSSRNMHVIAQYMSSNNLAHGFALDMRGHGDSGEKGKIAYIGQLEDDMAEIINTIRYNYPSKKIIMTGFSAGGGFAIRFAGSQYGRLVNTYFFLTPFLHPDTPINRPPSPGTEDQWMSVYLPRIIGLSIANLFGITSFNNLPVIEYRIPDIFQEEYTAEYSYNLSENFRPHKDYIGDIRKLKLRAVLFAGNNDQGFIAEKYRDELAQYSNYLWFKFINDAGHLDMVLDEKVFQIIVDYL